MRNKRTISLLQYTSQLTERLCRIGRERTAETYIASVRSFLKFTGDITTDLCNIDAATITRYNYFLKDKGLSSNTISFYIRIYEQFTTTPSKRDSYPIQHPFDTSELPQAGH